MASSLLHESFVGATSRRTEVRADRTIEFYPNAYAVAEEPVAHVKFALRHEPCDLTVLVRRGCSVRSRLAVLVEHRPDPCAA